MREGNGNEDNSPRGSNLFAIGVRGKCLLIARKLLKGVTRN